MRIARSKLRDSPLAPFGKSISRDSIRLGDFREHIRDDHCNNDDINYGGNKPLLYCTDLSIYPRNREQYLLPHDYIQ